jgi:DNA end-binding protein Ku
MPHAIWSGSINFGLVTIPVKLYSAIREHELHFNLLHEKDLGRIRYERVCSVDGHRVAWSDIVRGFPYGKDEYVVITDEDLKKASPEASRSVDIVEFVDLSEIDPILFDIPYYLAPERNGRHAYALLREALAETGKVGIARVVLRAREHIAVVKPQGSALVVEMMHWADEVVAPTDLDVPKEAKGKPAEMKMAKMLIETMSAQFEPREFQDRYREDLMKLIEAKAEGRRVAAAGRPRPATNVVDLAHVLEKSLAEQRKRRAHGEPATASGGHPPRRRRSSAKRAAGSPKHAA